MTFFHTDTTFNHFLQRNKLIKVFKKYIRRCTVQWWIKNFPDPRRGCFLVKISAKMKELGPIGGRAPSVTVKNIPTREIIPPVFFRGRKSVKNILGVCFYIRQYIRYALDYVINTSVKSIKWPI